MGGVNSPPPRTEKSALIVAKGENKKDRTVRGKKKKRREKKLAQGQNKNRKTKEGKVTTNRKVA